MALNNYGAGYGSYVYPQQQFNTTGFASQNPVVQQVAPTPSSAFVWVQGEAGAKSYPVAPGNRVALFDSENPVVYIKSVDYSGKPAEMEIFDLVKREPKPIEEAPKVDFSSFITRDEVVDVISASVSKEVEKAISGLSLKPAPKKKKEVDE